MKIFRFIVVVSLVWGATGCGRKFVPVSLNTDTKQIKTDSTASTKKDSSNVFFKETVDEKKLPEASVGLTLTRAGLDSLLNSLKGMPSVTRTIVLPDKGLRAQLSILMDSLGNIQLKCTSLEKIYWEKNTTQAIYIEKLVTELAKANHQISSLKETVVKEQKSWWATITENLLAKVMIYFILGGLTVILIRTLLKQIPFLNKFIP